MKLKLVSINIEGQKHLELVKQFLTKENADIVCLMEVCKDDILDLASKNFPFVIFAPNDVFVDSGKEVGVGMLSKYPIYEVAKYGCEENQDKYTKLPGMGTHMPLLLFSKIMVENEEFRIGAIHFSWTKDGKENERQVQRLKKLLTFLKDKDEFVLCGDFNIPRKYKLYYALAEKYKDNIPEKIKTTIDPVLHRANFVQKGKLQLVVDYVWSTPKYRVSEVRVEQGVSDHCGVGFSVAKI